MDNLMLDLLRTITQRLAKESKKAVKSPELLSFMHTLERLKIKGQKIIAKGEKSFNKHEFQAFIGACAVYTTELDEIFHNYMNEDLKKEFTKEGNKHGNK